MIMNATERFYYEAKNYLPGGVAASVRFNKALGYPMYISRGDGCLIYDLDGREYVDMCISHGASLLGHNHPKIKAALHQALDMGIICSYDTIYHTALAKKSSTWFLVRKWCALPVQVPNQ